MSTLVSTIVAEKKPRKPRSEKQKAAFEKARATLLEKRANGVLFV